MIPLVEMLASAGISLVSEFIDKGKDEAVNFIKEKTGIDLLQKRKLTLEEVQKLKEFEVKNKELILKLIEDRKDARRMQIEALKQDDWFAKNFINLLATFWSVCAVVYVFALLFINIPKDNIRFADTTLGFLLGTIVASIIGFYYGSSLGSKEKDKRWMN